jgi:hypothetical protein
VIGGLWVAVREGGRGKVREGGIRECGEKLEVLAEWFSVAEDPSI